MGFCLLLCLLVGVARADQGEPPLVDRPADLPFSEASAGFAVQPDGVFRVPFHLDAVAAPTEVEPLAPVTFTVTIRAARTPYRPPRRIDLREVPAFTRAFHVEDVTDDKKEMIGSSTWRWVYRLRPKGEAAREVPGFPFVFYNPDIRPPAKAFQTIYTDPIPLQVRPTEMHTPGREVPPSVMNFATGLDVLARRTPWTGPSLWLTAGVIVGPPLVAAAWFLVWRRLYPDAARQARLRQGRAARRALRRLEAARRRHGRQQAEGVAQALAGYLRERFDLVSAEPTPAEVERLLTRQGCAADQASEAADLLADCAAGRFQPDETEGGLVERAKGFVQVMEERLCAE